MGGREDCIVNDGRKLNAGDVGVHHLMEDTLISYFVCYSSLSDLANDEPKRPYGHFVLKT